MSCQAPLCFTQPPQYRCRCGEGPCDEHHPGSFSYRLQGHPEGLYRILDYPGSALATVEETVPEVRGVGGPFALRARQHDFIGFIFQPGKHTRGILLSQDTEDDTQSTLAVHGAYPGERRRESGRVVPAVDHHGDALDLAYLEPSGKRLSDCPRDLVLDPGRETP